MEKKLKYIVSVKSELLKTDQLFGFRSKRIAKEYVKLVQDEGFDVKLKKINKKTTSKVENIGG